ncbi:DUF4893 domain-containing protein [Sphingomonas sp.]|uniref:DUF4893 domain-containing protein n=1 Tax=Sphingomonas sp. TaxID=28214 RepID=UPI0031DE9193
MRSVVLAVLVSLVLAGCAAKRETVVVSASQVEIVDDGGAGQVIRPADQARIDALPAIWQAAWGKSPGRARTAEGALLEPGAALDHPELSPGSYNCRLIRLGRRAGARRMRSFPTHFCHVGTSNGELNFTKQTGSDLPAGHLYKTEKRYTFVGALQRAEGDNSLVYGTDQARDVTGVVERVGPFRWRMVVPMGEQDLDVLELTPVPVERQASS